MNSVHHSFGFFLLPQAESVWKSKHLFYLYSFNQTQSRRIWNQGPGGVPVHRRPHRKNYLVQQYRRFIFWPQLPPAGPPRYLKWITSPGCSVRGEPGIQVKMKPDVSTLLWYSGPTSSSAGVQLSASVPGSVGRSPSLSLCLSSSLTSSFHLNVSETSPQVLVSHSQDKQSFRLGAVSWPRPEEPRVRGRRRRFWRRPRPSIWLTPGVEELTRPPLVLVHRVLVPRVLLPQRPVPPCVHQPVRPPGDTGGHVITRTITVTVAVYLVSLPQL